MRIDIFTLCDGAYCYENKLTVIGAYDVMLLKNFTAAAITINLAAHIIFEADECGDNIIRIYGEELESGIKVLDLKDQITINQREDLGTGVLNVTLKDVPVIFPREGKYRFTLEVEGRGKSELILNVRQA